MIIFATLLLGIVIILLFCFAIAQLAGFAIAQDANLFTCQLAHPREI